MREREREREERGEERGEERRREGERERERKCSCKQAIMLIQKCDERQAKPRFAISCTPWALRRQPQKYNTNIQTYRLLQKC